MGLPAHPLIVQAPVILTPLIAVLAIVLVLRPAWLTRFDIPLAVSCLALSVLCILASGSGEKLEGQLAESELIEHHAELGEQLRNLFLFTACVIGLVDYDRLRRRGPRPSRRQCLHPCGARRRLSDRRDRLERTGRTRRREGNVVTRRLSERPAGGEDGG